jgi:hypothetical protein
MAVAQRDCLQILAPVEQYATQTGSHDTGHRRRDISTSSAPGTAVTRR